VVVVAAAAVVAVATARATDPEAGAVRHTRGAVGLDPRHGTPQCADRALAPARKRQAVHIPLDRQRNS